MGSPVQGERGSSVGETMSMSTGDETVTWRNR